MAAALLVWLACLAAGPAAASSAGSPSNANDLALYEAARARMGRGADAQVRMALWCEAHGLDSERLKHLTIAVLTDPAHATARGLLGLVAFRGHWQTPEAIRNQLEVDQTAGAALAEYNSRRARMSNSADSHWRMALWCQHHGLEPEAAAHLSMVTQLDPRREAAWSRLGYRRQGGRWVTPEQLTAENAEIAAQKKADKHWANRLAKLRSRLDDKSKKADVTQALAGIFDPRAVPSVVAIFAAGKASHQEIAVQVLGQLDSPGSTRALALLAVAGKSAQVRSKAISTLRRREPRDITFLLVGLLRDPELDKDPILYHFLLQPIGWHAIGAPGFLFVQGPRYNIFRTYTVDESRLISQSDGSALILPWANYPQRVMRQRQQQSADLVATIGQILSESEDDVLTARLHVRQVEQLNARIVQVLAATTGKNLSSDPEAWRKWWAEEQGYAYDPPPPSLRQDLTLADSKPTFVSDSHFSCFAAGTPLHTLTGLRAIESVQIGDQVLTQDPHTGALSYQPIVAAVHNKSDRLFKVTSEQESIKVTGIHRFWKVGQGWVMARELKPGDRLRSLGGVSTVESVASAGSEPVFNLRVMQAQSFFVGKRGTLVHDNSLVEPVPRPFDAMPDPPEKIAHSSGGRQ
jgi:hypothetical protein